MALSDTPQAGPLSIDDVLDTQPDPETDTPEVEDEIEEIEADAEADAEPEAEDEPETEDEGPQVLTSDEYGDVLVDLNGEATPLSELIKGNLRQSDYSRKTQEIAQQRKELEAELSQKEQAIAARERQLDERLSQLDEQEPDWVKLAEDDPLGWAEQRAKWDAKKSRAEAARQNLAKQQQKAVQEFARRTAEIAVSKIPEWSDAKKFDEGSEARKRVALEAGFTEAEYSQTHDFRLAVLLEKAARWDASQAKSKDQLVSAEKRLAKAPKVLKPGQSSSKSDQERARKAARDKRRSGPMSVNDYLKTFDIGD